MRATYLIAIAIAVLLGLWLLSGQFAGEDPVQPGTLAEQNTASSARHEDRAPTRVRGRVIHAQPQFQQVVVRGKTANKRTVEVRSEISGRVVERPVERGSQVETGDLLCRIAVDAREASLIEAREAFGQARIEYEGSIELQQKGFQSQTAIAQARARLAAAQAQVKRSELELERTRIRAPFAGIVEDLHVENGDFVTPGVGCVTLVDLDPMLLTGRISERDVLNVRVGQMAIGRLSDGSRVQGPVTFVGQQSDVATRTYALEVEIDNDDMALRSGVTAQLTIPVAEVLAQHVSSALFALDDEGRIGVRTVDEQSNVQFHHVEMVRDDADGVWVTGLPEVATLITVGQELVMPGERVEVEYEPASEMRAATPPQSNANTPALRTPASALAGS
jgi:multidrug efflux system membrane fusion protein